MLSQRDPAAVPLGYQLAKQYIADGDSDSAVELLRGMSKELTASGQFSQAAAINLMQSLMWMLWLLKSCIGQRWNTNSAQQGMPTR